MNNILQKELQEKGWLEINKNLTDRELILFAESFGKIIPHPNGKVIDLLVPKQSDEATKNTLSHRFGLNSFPLHTDTSFWNLPAKYIIMSCPDGCNTSTTLIHWQKIKEHLSDNDLINFEQAIYLVKTPNKTFYTKLIHFHNAQHYFRYDPFIMKPINKHAKNIDKTLNTILKNLNLIKINWIENKTIIIDNWKMLHGRESIKKDLNRKIKRIYIQ